MDKEAKLKEKKKIIIEALKRRLERSVYSNITVQEVADEAGFSKGGLLHYFQSKEDMYMELIRDVFEEIHEDHARVLNGNLDAREQAGISALYGVEKFFLDKRTTKIFLNLMLYAFEDENIMNKMKEFFHKHLEFYTTMIDRSHAENPQRRKTDIEPAVAARIAQIVMIGAGMFESVDQTNIDQYNLTRYVLSLIKG